MKFSNWKRNGTLAIECFVSIVALLLMVGPTFAENATQSDEVQTTVTAPSESKILGSIDIRPSWTSATGETHTEDTLQLGYQFNKKYSVDAIYYFNTNIRNPEESVSGLGVASVDGFLRGQVRKVWENESKNVALDYQARVYLPVSSQLVDAGRIVVMRNYFNLGMQVAQPLRVTLTALPVLHAYTKPGFTTATGRATANIAFENRFYLTTDIALLPKLNLSLPVLYHTTWYRDYDAKAAFNSGVGHLLYIWPELTYSINDHFAVALAYYSDNLIAPDFSGFNIGGGLERGIYQVSLQAYL